MLTGIDGVLLPFIMRCEVRLCWLHERWPGQSFYNCACTVTMWNEPAPDVALEVGE